MIPDNVEPTQEQKKQVTDLLFNSKLRYLFIAAAYIAALFASNLACVIFGNWYLIDRDPNMIMGFRFLCSLTNLTFLTIFFNRALEANHDRVVGKIKEIFKK